MKKKKRSTSFWSERELLENYIFIIVLFIKALYIGVFYDFLYHKLYNLWKKL